MKAAVHQVHAVHKDVCKNAHLICVDGKFFMIWWKDPNFWEKRDVSSDPSSSAYKLETLSKLLELSNFYQ